MEEHNDEIIDLKQIPKEAYVLVAAFALFIAVIFALGRLEAPRDFPRSEVIEIPQGTNLKEVTNLLEKGEFVKSSFFLQLVLVTQFGNTGIQAGSYVFNEPLGTIDIARAITSGTHQEPPIRITIFEGLRNDQVDQLVSDNVSFIEPGAFLAAAGEGAEGYLFPDTYYIPKDYTASELVELMRETYQEKISQFEVDIFTSGYTEEEIITMASILEREANTEESKKLVAGILWKRLAVGMPLQVDATFEYFLDKSSANLTRQDLQTESPYNTYLNAGLPPTPIANPGLQAIEAALNPTESPYLYYLTGNDGLFRYARTFEEHKQNIALYLR